MTIPLETERLSFRDWNVADLETFHSICADPRVMQFVGDGEAGFLFVSVLLLGTGWSSD